MAASTEPNWPKVYLHQYIEASSVNGEAVRRLRSRPQ